jgi:hypothetical protein
MKFFNVVLPVLALFTAVSAVPTAVHEDTVAKRQSVDVLTLITDLTNTVKTYTSQISRFSSSLSASRCIAPSIDHHKLMNIFCLQTQPLRP